MVAKIRNSHVPPAEITSSMEIKSKLCGIKLGLELFLCAASKISPSSVNLRPINLMTDREGCKLVSSSTQDLQSLSTVEL